MYLDENRYAIRGDTSFSTYTVTANISASRAGATMTMAVGHTNGGDDERERLHMMAKILTVLYTPRALHTSLVSFHSTLRAGWPALQAGNFVASAEQASEPRAGLRMVHSTYRKDPRAGVASPADQLAPVILLPSHHASKATLCGQNGALRASRAPLVTTVDLVGAVATPETHRPGPGGQPGPGGSSRGLIPAQPEMHPAGLTLC